MRRNRTIDSNTIKLIFLIASTAIMLIVNIVSTAIILKKSNHMTEDIYFQNCQNITDGYKETIESNIELYKSALDTLYYPEYFKTLDSSGMVNYLKKYSAKFHPDFKSVYYIDSQGMAWFTDNKIIDVTDRDIYREIIKNGRPNYLNDPVMAKNPDFTEKTQSPVVIFGLAVYDNDNQVKGALCASIKISTFTKGISDIHIGEDGKMAIQDKNGRFISHQDPNVLNKKFNPANIDFARLVSGTDEKAFSNVVETINLKKEPIYIFYRHIKNTEWVLAFYVPQISLQRIRDTQNFYQIIIVCISGLMIIVIILIEMYVSNYLQKKLMITTNIDPLTHLQTREHFDRDANRTMIRNRASKFMLLEGDIRGFKFINEKYGEAKGNRVLVHFSSKLNEMVNRHNGIACRGYADHFYALIKIQSVRNAMRLFQNCLEQMKSEISAFDIQYTPKFGITFYLPKTHGHIISVQKLISQANVAKNTIKDDALKSFALYNSELFARSTEDNYIESHMTKALENQEFFVMYQPKISLKDDKIVGAEALVRWQSSELGLMAPYKFIPLFEKNNFIIKLDFYVYEEVFKFLRKCIDANIPVVPVSVNMSRNHSKPDKFVHDFVELMKKYEIPADLVEVELLERSSMDSNVLREITLMLHNEGLTVAMDDFGSGESSLNMLSNIPVDVLKFDRSFLLGSNMENSSIDSEKANFIQTLVNLGKNLKKQTIFEGVETEEQRNFLKSIDCDQVQGYFYSKPLSEIDFMTFVRENS